MAPASTTEGKNMTEGKKGPVWGYRKGDDGVEARLFKTGGLPRGWKDTPAKVKTDGDNS